MVDNGSDAEVVINEEGFCIGIDLGTTHSVTAFSNLKVEHLEESSESEVFEVPQLSGPGTVTPEVQLPSFIYTPHIEEISADDLGLPWDTKPPYLVGDWARALGAKTSDRLVSSAKSWLSHASVDRKSSFLPLEAPEDVQKISPFEASKAYLSHMQSAWNDKNPEQRFEEQSLVLTVPASFDPAARELTAQAAKELGFNDLTLLEEPQAALYAWLSQQGSDWRNQLSVGDILLVVDIGGGTSDFSLISVAEADGELLLERVAVGDHILLGGDNMDLALAYSINAKLQSDGKRLQTWQVLGLTQACREAKEKMLLDPELDTMPIVVPSRGSKLIGGSLRTELTREMLNQTLLEGFFPEIPIDEMPKQTTRGALTKLGLPYAQDAGISRHLAAFLTKHVAAVDEGQCGFYPSEDGAPTAFVKPSAILLNGGVFKASNLSERLLGIVNTWLAESDQAPTQLLEGADLDLAVARGAAYYGQVRAGRGVRIRGGVAHSYYVGIESAMPAVPGMPIPMQALCIAPFGMEEGSRVVVSSQEFGLVIGQPVRFQFFSSNMRREDAVGDHLEDWSDDELQALPDIQATLEVRAGYQEGQVVKVALAASVTEIGTLKLEAVPLTTASGTPCTDREAMDLESWQVELDVRDQIQ